MKGIGIWHFRFFVGSLNYHRNDDDDGGGEEEMAWYAGDSRGGSFLFDGSGSSRGSLFPSYVCMYAAVPPS